MANKQSFTPQEWTKILESTMLAGMAVTAAEPSGLWGLMKEGFASSSALAQAKADASSNELIKAVVAEYETSEGRAAVQEALRTRFAGAKPGDAVQRSLDNLREVSAILAAKAPGDAPGFKAWLSSISQKVAEASSEGGFLGIGECRLAVPRRLLWATSQRRSVPALRLKLLPKKCERPLGSACGRKNFSVLDCDRAMALGAECLRSVLQG